MMTQINDMDDPDRRRLFVIFDSDARADFDAQTGVTRCDRDGQEYGPSRDSRALRDLCGAGDIEHHQLRRRAIENYLPVEALDLWAVQEPRSRATRTGRQRDLLHDRVGAFRTLDNEQRAYFNMKKGLARDEKTNERGRSPIFESLREEISERLRDGFGEALAELFHPSFEIDHKLLCAQAQELEPIIERILARI